MSRAVVLPVLREHQAALETCVYCPKLCRTTCPVAEVAPTELVTPWGKMTLAWELGTERAEAVGDEAAALWACTGCGACQSACRHDNPVYDTLLSARDAAVQAGHGAGDPAWPKAPSLGALLQRTERVRAHAPRVGVASKVLLLLGCAYAGDEEVAAGLLRLTAELVGEFRVLRACCGAPFRQLGLAEDARACEAHFIEQVSGAERVLVADPGCAVRLGRLARPLPYTLLLDLAHENLERFAAAPALSGAFRWHDPCHLGRELGRYEEPRRLLERVLGQKPEEFVRVKEEARCSGAGGGLARTMPERSRGIADARLAEHAALGGGTLVTACGSSLRRFRSRGADTIDLHVLLARALKNG